MAWDKSRSTPVKSKMKLCCRGNAAAAGLADELERETIDVLAISETDLSAVQTIASVDQVLAGIEQRIGRHVLQMVDKVTWRYPTITAMFS